MTDAQYLARGSLGAIEVALAAIGARQCGLYVGDALVTLTNGPAWLIDPVNGDSYTGGSSSLAAVAGYPSVTVPAGHILGLPVGISFTGKAWSEARLLQLAADFERRTAARRKPDFRASVVW